MKDDRDDIEKARERRLEQDRADLANEVAGRDVGRVRRFLPETAQGPRSAVARQRREREHFTLRMLLAIDATYKANYARVEAKIGAAQIATAGALSAIDAEIAQRAEALDDVLTQAARMSDGRAVFRDAAGNALTEDGELLMADEAAQIEWRAGAPSWEDYRARKQVLAKAQATRDEILHYQLQVLDPALDRMVDEENPPSEDELEAIEAQIETDMPALVRERYNPRTRVGAEHDADGLLAARESKNDDLPATQAGGLAAADLGATFNDAGRETGAAQPRSTVDLSIPKL